MKDYKQIVENIRKETKDYVANAGLKSLVCGISGGIDSALVVALLRPVCDELDIPLIGRSITIETNKEDEVRRSIAVGNAFCTNFKYADLTEKYLTLRDMFDEPSSVTNETETQKKIRLGNVKARMRMLYLYDLAQKNQGLVLSTDNLTELYCGFWTLHGDVGDYGCIQSLWKTEVYTLSKWLIENELKTDDEKNALVSCIECVPTDGLGITSSDLEQLGAKTYEEVDTYLYAYIFEDGKVLPGAEKVVERYERTHFKRNNPYNLNRNQLLKNDDMVYIEDNTVN